MTLTGTLAEINATLGAANNVVYRGAQDFFGDDTLTIVTNDGGNGGGAPLIDADQVTIHLNTHLTGTPSDDSYHGAPRQRADRRGRRQRHRDVRLQADRRDVHLVRQRRSSSMARSSHTILTGFETFVFTDGTVRQQ